MNIRLILILFSLSLLSCDSDESVLDISNHRLVQVTAKSYDPILDSTFIVGEISFHYNSDNKISEEYFDDNLRRKYKYNSNQEISTVEQYFNDLIEEELQFEYEDGSLKKCSYRQFTRDSNNTIYETEYHYIYSGSEIIKKDSFEVANGLVINESIITENLVEYSQINPEEPDGTETCGVQFKSSNIPNFFKSFGVLMSPRPLFLEIFSYQLIDNEILFLTNNLPSQLFSICGSQSATYDYSFQNGIIDLIKIDSQSAYITELQLEWEKL